MSPNLIETKVYINVVTGEKVKAQVHSKTPIKPDLGSKFRENPENMCASGWQRTYATFHKNTLQSWKSERKGKFLVYSCKSKECKGGYGNRMRSLASLFYLAMLTDRVFIIDWEAPFPLDKYLEEKDISWNYDLHKRIKSYRENLWPTDIFRSVTHLVKNQNMKKYFNHTVEVIKYLIHPLFKQLQLNPFLRKKAKEFGFPLKILDNHIHAMGCAFHFLFRLNSDLETEVEKTASMMGYDENIMLSIHIRTGDLNTFRTKTKDLRLPKSNFKEVFTCARLIQIAIQKKYNTTNVGWFLATDSWDLKNYAKIRYPNTRQYYGLIEHIEISTLKNRKDALYDPRNPPGDGMKTIMLEQYLMAKSDFFLHYGGSFGDAASGLALAPSVYYGALKRPNFTCVLPEKLKNT